MKKRSFETKLIGWFALTLRKFNKNEQKNFRIYRCRTVRMYFLDDRLEQSIINRQ